MGYDFETAEYLSSMPLGAYFTHCLLRQPEETSSLSFSNLNLACSLKDLVFATYD